MTQAEELLIRAYLAGKVSATGLFGRVIPSPVYFNEAADYWASIDNGIDYDTAYEIDTTRILFACLYFKGFSDDEASAPHSPLTTYRYELYVFSQYDIERADENILPDAFNKLMLKYYNAFIVGVLALKVSFQGELNIPGLVGYTEAKTLPLLQLEDIQNRVECEFIPGVRGTVTKFEIGVRLQTEDC